MPSRNFGGGRVIYSGQRFSPAGMRSSSSAAFRQHAINSNGSASVGTRQLRSGNINRSGHLSRSGNNPRLTQARGFGRHNGATENHGNRAGQIRHGNNLPSNWRNHVIARHSANWHRDWDRRRDHTWNGHHCRFINGSWVIFDFGFYPWWPYWYPSDYYAYDYYPYPYSYGPGYYDPRYYYDSGVDQDDEYYDQNGYESSDRPSDSIVVAAQDQLARQGYYRGKVDGVLGPQTRRALARYQSNHGLRVTGYLTTETLQALGLRRVASN